jgi:hypothetical protein
VSTRAQIKLCSANKSHEQVKGSTNTNSEIMLEPAGFANSEREKFQFLLEKCEST